MDALDAWCQALPKTELHIHLLGAVLPATFAEWAARAGMPAAEADALYARDARPKGVLHILRALEQRLLKRPADLHRAAYEHLAAAAAQNVRHSELFWNPTGTAHLFPYATGADAILASFADAAAEFGVSALLIPAIDREDTPEAAEQLVEWMAAHRREGIVGLGIDYRETDRPPELFWRAWAAAKRAGFRLTAHAGEFGCHPRNIRTALELVGVDRLDHAYTAVEDPALLARLRDSAMVVTVVPTNSHYLRTLAPERWALDHPIRAMAAAGLAIHPNTDDPPMHRVTPARCWAMMARDFGFGREELRRFTLNGVRGSFLEDAAKRHLEASFAAAFDALEFPSV
ncbi:adenosine deaminase [Roseococcus sp. DSY-14]|uniref:adenosine deaminase family protein n=1 Tax=Roseococcus sp. DSY-14 TaxID=3369650 RepID=UPI00387B20F2